jgi:hypothetical protein
MLPSKGTMVMAGRVQIARETLRMMRRMIRMMENVQSSYYFLCMFPT